MPHPMSPIEMRFALVMSILDQGIPPDEAAAEAEALMQYILTGPEKPKRGVVEKATVQ